MEGLRIKRSRKNKSRAVGMDFDNGNLSPLGSFLHLAHAKKRSPMSESSTSSS